MGKWILWLLAGAALVCGGIVALLNPLAATLTAEQIAGWIFLISGILQVWAGFRDRQSGAQWMTIILGALGIVVGIVLLARPLEGVVALTILVAAFFLASGVAKLVLGYNLYRTGPFWVLLLSGALSVLLGFWIILGIPATAAVVIGTLLAIDLVSSGAALIVFAWIARRMA